MTDALSKLRDLPAKWRGGNGLLARPRCARDLEDLLPALEQRERELRLDEALKFQVATFEAGFVFKFAEKRVADLRAALNPTEQKGAGVAPRRSRA